MMFFPNIVSSNIVICTLQSINFYLALYLDSRAREDFSESDWDNENEEEKENERTMGENDEDAAFKLLNHSKTQE